MFEEEFRHALRAAAQSGRALEINTRLPMHATILTWWHEKGGDAITFGSDAHLPSFVAHGFADGADGPGPRLPPGNNPHELWDRID
ncbi:hypothetical protein AB0M47_05200 [Hamadaea sp. NPDC051192]|uniref:hypothetical protein n=1 Tax=Hamadaea sp. NPDC051192 TaxID=3154940 RepID=UPI003425437C